MTDQAPQAPLLTQRQVAAALGVSVRTVQRLRASSALPTVMVRGGRRFTREAIESCIRARSTARRRDNTPTCGAELVLSSPSPSAWARRQRLKRGDDLPRPFRPED